MANSSIQENMNYNKQIMLAVMDKFLEDPPNFYIKNDSAAQDSLVNPYVTALSQFKQSLVLWHLAVLFDEFVIDQHIVKAVFGKLRLDKTTDHFNRRGQKLYKSLNDERNKKIQ